MGFASPIPKRGRRRKIDSHSAAGSPPLSQLPLPNDFHGSQNPFGQRMQALFISKKGADAVCSTVGFGSISHSSSETEPEIGVKSQESPAKDALLHLLVRVDVKNQRTGAITTLARTALHATALTSPSSISRPLMSSAANPEIQSASSDGTGTKLGSSAKGPELVYDKIAKLANTKAHGSPPASMQENEAAPSTYVTPATSRKRTMSLPASTPSSENIKRSQMVGDDLPRSSCDALNRKSIDTSSEAISITPDPVAIKAKQGYDKNVDEEQAQTPEGDREEIMSYPTQDCESLTTKSGRNSRARELQQHLEGRALKAERELKLTKNRLQVVESELDASHTRESSTGVIPQHEETHVPQDHQTKTQLPSTENTSLATVVRERDQFKQDNETLLEKNTSLQADNLTYRRLYEHTDYKLTTMRYELETSPLKFAETDGLLQGKADRYNDLMREHNEVIGHNTQLKGEIQDLKMRTQEELASKDTELNEYKASERYLGESRDRHMLFASRVVGWLRRKMTAGEVEYMTDCAWFVTRKDCKILAEKVVYLRTALRSSNKARLATNNESRLMRRTYDAKIQENEELLEYRKDSQIQLEALHHQLKDHIPACKTLITSLRTEAANQQNEIAALKKFIEAQDQKHKASIAKGASHAMQDVLDGNQHMITNLLAGAKSQAAEIATLKSSLESYSLYISEEEGRLQDYVARMEFFKIRAYAAEDEVTALRQQLDKSDESLADPRKWEHHQTCSEWRAQAKIVVEEMEGRREKTAKVVEGLWGRMLDFEFQAKRYGMLDPDSYLGREEPRRGELRRWIRELWLYDVDAVVGRRREVDRVGLDEEEEEEEEDESTEGSEDGDEEEDEEESSREDGRKEMSDGLELNQQADPQEFVIYDEEGFLQTPDPEHELAGGEEDWDTTQGTVDDPVSDHEDSPVTNKSYNELDPFEDSEIIR